MLKWSMLRLNLQTALLAAFQAAPRRRAVLRG
jgi:hypothetical protein